MKLERLKKAIPPVITHLSRCRLRPVTHMVMTKIKRAVLFRLVEVLLTFLPRKNMAQQFFNKLFGFYCCSDPVFGEPLDNFRKNGVTELIINDGLDYVRDNDVSF